ncbi:MAG: protease pro-enzyme activation domain-containing protein [Betaproteobacteria bacterium]
MRINAKMTTGLLAAATLTAQGALAAPTVHARRIEAPAAITAAAAQDTVEFSVYLPLRHKDRLETLLAQLHDEHSPKYHQWLQPEEFLQRFGPSPAELETVRRVLVGQGLTIVSSNAHGVRVRGTAAAVTQAMGAPLQKLTAHGHTRFQARQHPRVPSDLAGIDLRIVGLDALPERHVHARVLGQLPNANVDNRYGTTGRTGSTT